MDSCLGGSDVACDAARKDAQEKQNTYQNLSYQNQKEAQEGYRQIQQLLNDTGPEAKQTQELYNGMVASYVRTGMSEADAKTAVGYQLGAMYIAGGIAGIGSGKAVDEALTPGVKPSTPSTKPGTGNQTVSKPSNGAENAANTPKLNSQLSAQEIANGHAFEKHVLQRGEFDTLGIKTRNQFAQHVENVINNPTDVRYYSDGRVAYLDSTTRTVVIRNPSKGESTAFRPDYGIGWDNYIKRLPIQNTPLKN
ncbi:hypothetical protein [Hafnia alvei]|uniref:hypothetical protein n=1 Tax=Hafnia alvei TaxID=569 RepID=UPI0024A9FEFF|nr:hypothetical protein [Hafnia alvei]